MTDASIRLGADIGGTFTDVVLEVGSELHSTKVLTTYTAPENAIIDGMHQVCKKAGISPTEIQQIIHGTCLLYTSPSPRDLSTSRMPSSA